MPDPSLHRFRFARTILALSMLIMGACGIIYEYTLGVLGNNLIGSSHEQIFVIIGIMMFGMGLGAVVQKRIVGSLVDRFLFIELLLGFVGGVSTLVIYATFVYSTSYWILMYAFALAIGVLIGLEIPLLIRINAEYARSLRTNLSDILCMDYVGSLVGALIFTYILLTRLSVGRISLVLGCVNTLLAIGGLVYFWPLVRRPRPLALASGLTMLFLLLSLVKVDGWTASLEQRCFEDPIVHSETTKYQHLVLTKRGERLRLYINGHQQFCSQDEVIYHETLVHVPMSVVRRRQRVLILGGGDGLALREVLRYGDVQRVTLVDIDPAVVRLATEHPDLIRLNRAAFHDARVHTIRAHGVSPGKKIAVTARTKLANQLVDQTEYPLAEVHVVTIDADLFVREVGETYDVAILDFPDPKNVELAKLYSVNFYRALARRLAPEAVVSVQSTSPYQATKVFLCIGKTLRAAGFRALPFQDHLPSFGDWGWHLAWLGATTEAEMRDRLRRLSTLAVQTDYATCETIDAAFVFGKNRLHSDKDLLTNTRFRPVIMDYYREGFW
jgi:spermidine synthase